MRRLALFLAIPLLLNGCAGMLLTTGTQAGMAIAENRSIGRKVDDTVIYTDLTNQFLQADKAELLGKVTFNVRYARVMLTGNIATDEEASQAIALSWKAKGVTEVINELVVNPESSFLDTAGDSFIKRNLESRLLITKGVWVINYSIDVTNGTAYLIGRVKDQAELDRALNVARTTKGIKRVVSHLQINADTQQPTVAPDGSGQPMNSSTNSNSSSNAAPSDGGVYTGPVYGNSNASSSATSSTVDAPSSISSTPLDAPKGGGY
ncbi:MAG: BON domain-containing protein [Pseudomonadota bacterium]